MGYNTKEFEEKLKKTISAYENNLDNIRASQANPKLLSRISFEYYGSPTPLNTMADIRVTDARTLTIMPYDKTTLKAIEKAILASDLGITPNNDGQAIRLVFPQLTQDRRKELSKQISKMGEEAKVAARMVRKNANDEVKKLKKDSILTEDDEEDAKKKIQDLTDKYIKQIDVITDKKIAEIMAV